MPDRLWPRPEPLDPHHITSGFSCGQPELDDWLARRALTNQTGGATKTHVVAEGGRVIGFYSLASAVIAHRDARGRDRRNMPDPIPAVILARMAVDQAYRGQGLGAALLLAAIVTTTTAAEGVGIACLLVHAKDDEARSFYQHFGFEPSPTDPLHLVLRLADLR
jgi:GNAT superfamily N-acetyltransferase